MENIISFKIPDQTILSEEPLLLELGHNKKIYLRIPTVAEYEDFEYRYLDIVFGYFKEFVDNDVFSFQDLTKSKKFKGFDKKFMNSIMENPVRQFLFFRTKTLRTKLNAIIKKYFTANFPLKEIEKRVNPIQYMFLFVLLHSIIFTVKKNHIRVLKRMTGEKLETYTIFSSTSSIRPKPRYKI